MYQCQKCQQQYNCFEFCGDLKHPKSDNHELATCSKCGGPVTPIED